MAFRKIIVASLILFLWGCAQVGQITGGEKDVVAPKPIAALTTPPDSSLDFTEKKISFSFDEFIQLNNPQQTLVIVPNHARLNATLKKKNVLISWEDELKENTTYVIYLNGTIQDVSEKNDTLLSYVFSTGNTIDSIEYNAFVVDAWKNTPLKNITVGLFDKVDSLRPYYFSQTGENGWAKFRYLKPGDFRVVAFDDKNKDLQIQPNEAIGFKNDSLQLRFSLADSLPIRLFQPARPKKITSAKFSPPASILLTTSFPLRDPTIKLNDRTLDDSLIHFFSRDSVQLFYPADDSIGTSSLVLNTEDFNDTVVVRVAEKDKKGGLTLKASTDVQYLQKNSPIEFAVTDIIAAINPEKISLRSQKDSIPIAFKIDKRKNILTLLPDSLFQGGAYLNIKAGAITSTHNMSSDSCSYLVYIRDGDEFGILTVHIEKFTDKPILLELLKGGRVVETRSALNKQAITFDALIPGEYSFRIIEDDNENGFWDNGIFVSNKQPEHVHWYSKPVKVRANWEMDITLTP